jgi:hypothetical protein
MDYNLIIAGEDLGPEPRYNLKTKQKGGGSHWPSFTYADF